MHNEFLRSNRIRDLLSTLDEKPVVSLSASASIKEVRCSRTTGFGYVTDVCIGPRIVIQSRITHSDSTQRRGRSKILHWILQYVRSVSITCFRIAIGSKVSKRFDIMAYMTFQPFFDGDETREFEYSLRDTTEEEQYAFLSHPIENLVGISREGREWHVLRDRDSLSKYESITSASVFTSL